MKRVLILASVASMIDQFNIPNIILLQKMGYTVDVACNFKEENTCSVEKIIELKKTLRKINVQCFQIDFSRDIMNIGRNIKAFKQVEKILEENHYNFLHCHSPIGGLVGRVAGKLKKTKVIYTAHGFHFYKGAPIKNWLIYYPVEKVCSYITDILICINKEDYELASKKMKAKRVAYVPGVGIDLSKFGNASVNRLNKRLELGVPTNQLWILAVGELIKRKNHENLIRAVAAIEDVYLTIAGKGELQDELLGLIKELGVESRIKLLGFRIDVSELCEAADVFAFPSYQEGLPVALMEAMASGKPVICSNVRGNTDLIDEGEGGYYFAPNKSEQIVDAITKIMSSDLDGFGKYNRQKIKKFDLTEVLKQTKEIYGGGYKNLVGLLKRWELRTSIEIEKDDVLLLSVGELNENKNHSVVIKALGEMRQKKRIHHFQYAIAGQGSTEKKLISLAKKTGIDDRFHELGFRPDIADWYQAADVFILPSLREGLSVSLIEAIASGLPCIVSDIRGNRDLIANNSMRFLPKDMCKLSIILEKLTIRDVFEQKKINLKYIQRYSLGEVMEMMHKLYVSLE